MYSLYETCAIFMYLPQESEMIEEDEEEDEEEEDEEGGRDDSAHSPGFEDKPKIQVSRRLCHSSRKYESQPQDLLH